MDFLPNIVYQDENMILARKGYALASSWGQEKSFLDIIKKYGSDEDVRQEQISVFGEEGEYGLLNRLDNVTAGLLYFARSYEAKANYLHLQGTGSISKTYYAQVYGTPRGSFGRIDTPIWHHRGDASCMTSDKSKGRGVGQEVMTSWEKIDKDDKSLQEFCRLKITITTGCRHQIRTHLASIGHPIVGDGLYMTPGLKKRYGRYEQPKKIELVSVGISIEAPIIN